MVVLQGILSRIKQFILGWGDVVICCKDYDFEINTEKTSDFLYIIIVHEYYINVKLSGKSFIFLHF
ncbi:MAG: hypothetical protein EAZ77_06545 [Nostocales cyanobacterium]|nr:MAG: hypothetical protein EAZ77_06545 [Nostocales cyanobacterium]